MSIALRRLRHSRSAVGAFGLFFFFGSIGSAGAEDIGRVSFTQLRPLGEGVLTVGTVSGVDSLDDIRFQRPDLDALLDDSDVNGGGPGATPAAALKVPSVHNTPVTLLNRGFSGFDALNHSDQRLAGTGAFFNTQFSLEPPDQGLCVGNGFVVETINTALAVYRTDGTPVAGPTALNQFFGLAPEVIRSTPPVFGDFTSDPRCYFDVATNRFFILLLQLDVDPATGNFSGPTHQLLAVSKTGDPTDGFNRFVLDTTADGDNCPCFGDQPLLGADANGIYISGNGFSLVDGRFKGAQIYAISKLFLAAGALPPFVLHINLPRSADDGGLNRSVHPATRAHGDDFSDFGTEYFLSAFSQSGDLENQVVAWALSNTVRLNFPPGPGTTFRFQRQPTKSETFGAPPDALQKIGTLPLGSAVNPTVRPSLATNAQNMQQVTFQNGRLWSTVATVVNSPDDTEPAGAFGDPNKAGAAWFAVKVDNGNKLKAKVDDQGYIAIKNANLLFPALGINRRGQAAIAFSISGPDLFPSAGYVQSQDGEGFGKIHIAAAGVNSEDGFTAYPAETPSPCDSDTNPTECEARWGDYGAAAVVRVGNIWLASVYIGPRPRTVLANWGTFITRLRPGDDDDHHGGH